MNISFVYGQTKLHNFFSQQLECLPLTPCAKATKWGAQWVLAKVGTSFKPTFLTRLSCATWPLHSCIRGVSMHFIPPGHAKPARGLAKTSLSHIMLHPFSSNGMWKPTRPGAAKTSPGDFEGELQKLFWWCFLQETLFFALFLAGSL